jgi:hypothetical protein
VKVVKLDGRHNLKHKGYAWAFKFNGWTSQAAGVERIIAKSEGWSYNNTFMGKAPDRYSSRPYWVGVKKESTVSMVLLSLKD